MENNKNADKSEIKIVTICFLLSLAIFILDSFIPLGVAGGVPYILVVLVSLWSRSRKLPIYMAIVISVLTVVGIYSSPSGGELWKILFNRFLALFAIWTTTILSVQRKTISDEREKALKEIKTLQGIIPICSYCHNIRDVEGAWNRLEEYIAENSESEFSHGICPECVVKVRAKAGLKTK